MTLVVKPYMESPMKSIIVIVAAILPVCAFAVFAGVDGHITLKGIGVAMRNYHGVKDQK